MAGIADEKAVYALQCAFLAGSNHYPYGGCQRLKIASYPRYKKIRTYQDPNHDE
jgi:hypothetical protein